MGKTASAKYDAVPTAEVDIDEEPKHAVGTTTRTRPWSKIILLVAFCLVCYVTVIGPIFTSFFDRSGGRWRYPDRRHRERHHHDWWNPHHRGQYPFPPPPHPDPYGPHPYPPPPPCPCPPPGPYPPTPPYGPCPPDDWDCHHHDHDHWWPPHRHPFPPHPHPFPPPHPPPYGPPCPDDGPDCPPGPYPPPPPPCPCPPPPPPPPCPCPPPYPPGPAPHPHPYGPPCPDGGPDCPPGPFPPPPPCPCPPPPPPPCPCPPPYPPGPAPHPHPYGPPCPDDGPDCPPGPYPPPLPCPCPPPPPPCPCVPLPPHPGQITEEHPFLVVREEKEELSYGEVPPCPPCKDENEMSYHPPPYPIPPGPDHGPCPCGPPPPFPPPPPPPCHCPPKEGGMNGNAMLRGHMHDHHHGGVSGGDHDCMMKKIFRFFWGNGNEVATNEGEDANSNRVGAGQEDNVEAEITLTEYEHHELEEQGIVLTEDNPFAVIWEQPEESEVAVVEEEGPETNFEGDTSFSYVDQQETLTEETPFQVLWEEPTNEENEEETAMDAAKAANVVGIMEDFLDEEVERFDEKAFTNEP